MLLALLGRWCAWVRNCPNAVIFSGRFVCSRGQLSVFLDLLLLALVLVHRLLADQPVFEHRVLTRVFTPSRRLTQRSYVCTPANAHCRVPPDGVGSDSRVATGTHIRST